MKTKFVAVFCAAVFLFTSAPVLALNPEPGGPGPYTIDLISDQGVTIGTLKVVKDGGELFFTLEPSGYNRLVTAQLWVGPDAYDATTGIPTLKGGAPDFANFPWQGTIRSKMPAPYEFALHLKQDLGFWWKAGPYFGPFVWNFMVSGRYVGTGGSTFIAKGSESADFNNFGAYWVSSYSLANMAHGQFIDSPVIGLDYDGPSKQGKTGDSDSEEGGGFQYFPGEEITFSVGSVKLGTAPAGKKVSPLDLFSGADINDPSVIAVAQTLQTLDEDSGADDKDGKIVLLPEAIQCFETATGGTVDWNNINLATHENLLSQLVADCNTTFGTTLELVAADEAQGNLQAGLNASGIFRKNISKTEDFGESKQKLEVMPVYFPGLRSNGDPSLCIDVNEDGVYDIGEDTLGVPYEEWRLNGDPEDDKCDPRVDTNGNEIPDGDEEGLCVITLIECREIAKPVVTTYTEVIDIYDDQITTDFYPGRFSTDIFTAISRDDGTTWKRMNVSRMADLSSFDLETGEPFPGTSASPYLKVNDNYILNVWESRYCKSGNPRYAIDNCALYPDDCVDSDGDGLRDDVCRGNVEQGTYECEEDYPFDDAYYVTDIWGVRGQQQSVDYDEVDDVAELGIGEIPYSCLWAARGVIVSQKELDAGTFDSLDILDDPDTEEDESDQIELGDIVWYKPERLTSGRRDAYIPVVGSARGAGFAIAWQEDPSGLRPGKGKGPGQGWSGAISNHKTDIWYTFLSYDDFSNVDANFVPGKPPESGGPDEKTGFGRPKSMVPFSLPARISDNDMVNTDTLKVELSDDCVTPPDGTEPVCFPKVVDGSYVPIDPEEIASEFCGHPDADPATCCDPADHEGDPNCEDLKGLYGNMTGTKRFAYLAKTFPEYDYFEDRGGTLDLCDTTAPETVTVRTKTGVSVTATNANNYMEELPGTTNHERWYGFSNVAGASKLVCVTADGRLLDGDVSASRPNIQMQPYTRPDGTRSAWVLLGYEESKGMGHSLDAGDHDNPVDEIIQGKSEEPGQDKGFKQDIGKNVIYHSFDFTEPDLVSPGHIVNLPALCGGLYPNYCGEDYDGDNPTCYCEPGQPIPLYFDYYIDNGDGTGEWMPDDTKFLQFRTEIARRVRFIMQSPGKVGATKTLGAIIYKQGQEGQGRPADVFIRPLVKSGTGNPYKFENFGCSTYLDQTFDLPGCLNDGVKGYMCNVWGEAWGDRLCGGVFTDPIGGFARRDHVNLTSADILMAVDAGPEDDTPDDPTDDVYGTEKVLLWEQNDYNLGQESYGVADTSTCTETSCAGMYSNARSHRGFVRGDMLVAAYAYSPNWAAGRNGNDRYNFYLRRSFDGGQTWTTTPTGLGGSGVNFCPEWRSDPTVPDPDGSGNSPPVYPGFDPECVDWCAPNDPECVVTGTPIGAGAFEPARKVSQFDNNKETSSDPRVGATPPVYPLDGRIGTLPVLRFVEDEYKDHIFFVAWGGGDNIKYSGSTTVTPEAPPTDLWYTRTQDYGDHYLRIPWVIGGENSNQTVGETVWRYDFLAKGKEEEQGECQLRATSDGSKVYAIYHQLVPAEDDGAPITRWYPWEPEESHLNDLWFRRVIFWPDQILP